MWLANFFYNEPLWLWCGTLVLVVSAIAYFVVVGAHKWIQPSRKADGGLVIGPLQIVATTYAFLLAFIAVNVLTTFQNASHLVEAEASHIGNIFRDASALPNSVKSEIQKNVLLYLTQVVEHEWPNQQNGSIDAVRMTGWNLLEQVNQVIFSLSAGAINPVIQKEMFEQLNELYTARRERILFAEEKLSSFMWGVLALGGLVVILSFAAICSDHFALKMFVAITTSYSLLLIAILIIALDRPFRGAISIDMAPYVHLKDNLLLILNKS